MPRSARVSAFSDPILDPDIVMKHPWLFVIGAFLLLIAAWTSLLVVATRYSPQTVEISR